LAAGIALGFWRGIDGIIIYFTVAKLILTGTIL
jgi:hypothetical protein